MALFKLTIYDICTDAEPTDTSTILTKSLLTDMQLVEINGYQYALVGLNMMKQMYQPTEIIADIHIQMIEGRRGQTSAGRRLKSCSNTGRFRLPLWSMRTKSQKTMIPSEATSMCMR